MESFLYNMDSHDVVSAETVWEKQKWNKISILFMNLLYIFGS